MKNYTALSVRQPWASLIALGEKTIEHRTWRTNHRGELLIVASARPLWGLPAGCSVALVNLIDCRQFEAADLEAACMEEHVPGYAWVLANIRPVRPWPIKGRLHLYQVSSPAAVQILSPQEAEELHKGLFQDEQR